MIEACRDMHLICAWQSRERQLACDVPAGNGRGPRTSVGYEIQKDGDQSRHAHDCDHWRLEVMKPVTTNGPL